MSDRLQTQADRLWQLLTAPSTADAYRQAIQTTWQILKETGLFLWLVLCLVLVGSDWLGNTAIRLGKQARTWFQNFQTIDSQQIAPETGKAILDLGKTSITATVAQARAQLGLPEKPATEDPPAAPIAPSPSPAIAPPSPAPRAVSEPAPAPPVTDHDPADLDNLDLEAE